MNRVLRTFFSRPRPLHGGIFLPRLKAAVTSGPARTLPLPPVLAVPLGESQQAAATPMVAVGQTIEFAEQIGRGERPGTLHVHAPARGRVVGMGRADTARCVDVPTVRIEVSPDQPPAALTSPANAANTNPGAAPDGEPPALETIVAGAERAGLPAFGADAAPLAELLRKAAGETSHLLINALAGEPVAGEWRPEQPAALIRISDWIGRAIGARRVIVAADAAERRSYKRLRAAARRSNVQVAGLINKYPQHARVLLAHSLAGIETPPGRDPLEAGVLVLEGEALLHLAGALGAMGDGPTPMTHRMVSVAGSCVTTPGRYWIALGTSFAHVLDRVGFRQTPKRVIDGGPLTGIAVEHLDVVTTKQTSGLLVLDRAHDRTPAPGPCVRCGWCQEDCPVGLDPHMLLNFAERGDITGAAPYYPQACIECGVCSYVCPADLPLAAAAVGLKRARQTSEAGT